MSVVSKTVSCKQHIETVLKDKELCAEYLREAMKDDVKHGDPRVFLTAMFNVLRAQGVALPERDVEIWMKIHGYGWMNEDRGGAA